MDKNTFGTPLIAVTIRCRHRRLSYRRLYQPSASRVSPHQRLTALPEQFWLRFHHRGIANEHCSFMIIMMHHVACKNSLLKWYKWPLLWLLARGCMSCTNLHWPMRFKHPDVLSIRDCSRSSVVATWRLSLYWNKYSIHRLSRVPLHTVVQALSLHEVSYDDQHITSFSWRPRWLYWQRRVRRLEGSALNWWSWIWPSLGIPSTF